MLNIAEAILFFVKTEIHNHISILNHLNGSVNLKEMEKQHRLFTLIEGMNIQNEKQRLSQDLP